MITGFVTGQSLRLHHGVVASDTIDYLEAEFLFRTDDWRDASEIKAVFTRDDGTGEYAIPLTEGKIRKEDHLNLSTGLWKVHLVGCTYSGGDLVQRITTVPDFLRVEKAGAADGEPLPEVPATEVERLEAKIEDVRIAEKHVERAEILSSSSANILKLTFNDGSYVSAMLPGVGVEDVILWGDTDPTSWTAGKERQLYVNKTTGAAFICISSRYLDDKKWLAISGGEDTGGGITKEELASAVDDALASAKEAGEFDGEDGITPHIGADGNWFIGKTDTGVRAKGVDGKDGVTPQIGGNGNWFIGSTDTGVRAKGVDGTSPVKGKDYFTDADTAELVAAVIAGLPVYDGEAVIM